MEMKEDWRKAWFSDVKSDFVKSPLASNLLFCLFLTGLEKLVEYDFVCPCDPTWNGPLAAGFFGVPALLAFLLMIKIQTSQNGKCSKKCPKNLLISSCTAMIWFTLVFMDGNYLVCAKTNWSGTYVTVPNAAPRKWCDPGNTTSSDAALSLLSQKWFTLSQVIGLVFITVLAVVHLVCTIISWCCCCREEENPDEGGDQSNEQDTNV